ncbi:phage tail family protein [Peptostreptococcaceae bacterium OttesenSCG-928-C18]|nr:phage tail family protein [Peptostreptococcaceae bacterium OttesenSCG-928-C18]
MGFIYNGISSQSMKIKARLTSWQASPSLRNSFVSIPGKYGVADFGSDSAERTITVRCNIYPQRSFAALVSVLDNMAEWLDPAHGAKQVIFDDVPDRYFTARLSEAVDCERLILSAGAFDLKFVCPDPHAYALTDEIYTLTEIGNHEVRRRKGNTDSEPVYLLKGSVSSGSSSYISLITNNEELRIVGALASTETLVIDTGKVTAKVVDSAGETLRNGLPCLQELNFPVLSKGINTIQISTVGATFTELKIQAQSRWR